MTSGCLVFDLIVIVIIGRSLLLGVTSTPLKSRRLLGNDKRFIYHPAIHSVYDALISRLLRAESHSSRSPFDKLLL